MTTVTRMMTTVNNRTPSTIMIHIVAAAAVVAANINKAQSNSNLY